MKSLVPSSRLLGIGVLLLLTVGIIVWQSNTAPEPTPTLAATPVPPVVSEALPEAPRLGSPVATQLNHPQLQPANDVATLHILLEQYLTSLQNRPGRPIGDDVDLAKVLTGANPLKLIFLPPDHPAITAEGRMVDRWGQPFHIHPRTARSMEIRSAGPDRKLFTGDDLVANPPPPSQSNHQATNPAEAEAPGSPFEN